jgi:membrane associated rhomboid family serine protease
MFLFPYRAQIRLHRWPVMTLVVAAMCLLIFAAQEVSEARVVQYAQRVCTDLVKGRAAGADTEAVSAQASHAPGRCAETLLDIRYDPNPARRLDRHVRRLLEKGEREAAEQLERDYRAFAGRAPVLLTASLWHDRSRIDLPGMITSVFAHGSWEHVIFNLIFFFAFAAAVELLLGPVLFLGAIAALSLGIGLFDHFIAHWQHDPRPSLGLSGVVMGMLGLFVYFLPRAKIRFFFWFMLSIGTIGIPAWLVGLWYFGWDFYYQLARVGGHVNFVAHLSGAAFGLLIGVTVFRKKRSWARELVLEKPDLTQDEGWAAKINGIMVAPALAGAAFLAGLGLLGLVILFVERYGLILLLAAPAALAAVQLFRSRKNERPVRERYQLGIAALKRSEYQEALRHLQPLAERNDVRALLALGELHTTATGALRDEPRAADLLRRAAERGNAPAQYRFAILLADGRGMPRDTGQAIEWYEKAARGGVPDAAHSLAYLHENGQGVPADRERAIEWYYRAAVGYHRDRRADDVRAIIRQLENLAGHYPAVLGLVTKLKSLSNVRRD